VLEYFKLLASSEKNGLIFVSYQVNGTMGQRIQSGMKSAQLYNNDGKLEIFNIMLSNDTIEGFSGHSDRRQLVNYVQRLRPRPKRIFVIHGEESKCESLSRSLNRLRGVKAFAPHNLDTFTLA
jgi:predicted metal-dependent RNase